MERLKIMKEQLMSSAQGELGNLKEADAKELGEVIDMIKDLSEAIYYCTVTEAMQETSKEKIHHRDMDKTSGRMYYGEYRMPDYNEGRSPIVRKTYMESKMYGGDKHMQMKELEHYMRELSHDLTEMIEDASVEEKQMLQQKLNQLASKIV